MVLPYKSSARMQFLHFKEAYGSPPARPRCSFMYATVGIVGLCENVRTSQQERSALVGACPNHPLQQNNLELRGFLIGGDHSIDLRSALLSTPWPQAISTWGYPTISGSSFSRAWNARRHGHPSVLNCVWQCNMLALIFSKSHSL